ncbi:MAG TPA: FHA domain-containing protein [Phycisphaerae bacterium]|nr:FHA domain-containing protein [Phycisphaerae bacterium]
MFCHWLNARLKSARLALRNGRLDDAFGQLARPDALCDAAATPLLDELARSLAARARLHLQAGRYREALDDLDRLAAIGREDHEAKALRERTASEWKHRAERHRNLDDAQGDAAERIRLGRLESGRLAVERIEDAPRREQLREALDLRVQRSEQLLDQAAEAQASGDLLNACRLWSEAVARHGSTRRADDLARELLPAIHAQVSEWLRAGRLDRFRAAVRSVGVLRRLDPHWTELERDANLVQIAGNQLAAGEFGKLRETLVRLAGAHAEAKWIAPLLEAVRDILAAEERLLASPLGMIDPALRSSARFLSAAGASEAHNSQPAVVAAPEETGAAVELTGRGLLLLVDGTGSCLLLPRPCVRLGREGGGVEVPLPGPIQAHHADIVRGGEDYFLEARGPVRVNHRPVQRVLLRDGDRIVLGDSAKMTFHQPSAKIATAVLKLSSRSRLAQDVEYVVLFDGACTLGPQASAHVRTREGDTRVVLYEWEGRLYGRSDPSGAARPGRGAPLVAGQTRDFGDVRITVKEYDPARRGRVT